MSYPKSWDKTITIYNRKEDESGVVIWCRNIAHNCFMAVTNITNRQYDNETEQAQNIARIPLKQVNFKLKSGDIIVLGNVSDKLDEYIKGSRKTDLLNKYADCSFIIKNVSANNYTSTPHYKVLG